MHPHVHRDPAAVGAELGRRRLGVPLKARDLRDLPELSGRDPLAQRAQRRYEPPPIADLEDDPCALDRMRRRDRIGRGQPDRLLAQDGYSREGERLDELDVAIGRRGDQHAVEGPVLEQLGQRRERAQPPFGQLPTDLLDRFENRHNLDLVRARQGVEMDAAHPAGADHGDPKRPGAHSPRARRYSRLRRCSSAGRCGLSGSGSTSCSTTSQPP